MASNKFFHCHCWSLPSHDHMIMNHHLVNCPTRWSLYCNLDFSFDHLVGAWDIGSDHCWELKWHRARLTWKPKALKDDDDWTLFFLVRSHCDYLISFLFDHIVLCLMRAFWFKTLSSNKMIQKAFALTQIYRSTMCWAHTRGIFPNNQSETVTPAKFDTVIIWSVALFNHNVLCLMRAFWFETLRSNEIIQSGLEVL